MENPPAQLNEEDVAKHERALSSIVLCLDDLQLNYVRGKVSSKEIWEALRAIYARQTAGSKMMIAETVYVEVKIIPRTVGK